MTLEELESERAALPDTYTTPGVSMAQAEALERRRRILTARIDTIRFTTPMISRLDGKIAELETWRDLLIKARVAMCDELLTTHENATGRHSTRQAQDRLAGLKTSIMTIDRGAEYFGDSCVMGQPLAEWLRAHGVTPNPGQPSIWNGRSSLPETERRIEELQQQRAELQARIDAALATENKTPAAV